MEQNYNPPIAFHPGETLAEKLLEMGMGVKEFAVRTSKPEKTIFAVLKGRSSITSDMAVAFENVTRIPAYFWMDKQRSYDEYVARKKRERILLQAGEWAESFPLTEMKDLGWLDSGDSLQDRVTALFMFFQISSVKAWEDYYLNRQLKVSFHISLNGINDSHAVSAWLRQGEVQASDIQVPEYSEAKLKSIIPDMKMMFLGNMDKIKADLRETCAQVGVKLVFTPRLRNVCVNGATRWINGNPCIQMCVSDHNNEDFRFTFFHELGHILLHGKKDVFLEDVEYSDKQDNKEREADEFAYKILYSV